jgi:hypothetical protein
MGWGVCWKGTLQATQQVPCRAVKPLSIHVVRVSLPGHPLIEFMVHILVHHPTGRPAVVQIFYPEDLS